MPRVDRGFASGALGSVVEDLREPVKRATVAMVEAIVSAARFAGCLYVFHLVAALATV